MKTYIKLTADQIEYIKTCQLERHKKDFKNIRHFMLGEKTSALQCGKRVEGRVFRVYKVITNYVLDEQLVLLFDHPNTPVNWHGTSYIYTCKYIRKYKKVDIDKFYAGEISMKELLKRNQY